MGPLTSIWPMLPAGSGLAGARVRDANFEPGQRSSRGGEAILVVDLRHRYQGRNFRLAIDLGKTRHGKFGGTTRQQFGVGIGAAAGAGPEARKVETLALRMIEHGEIAGRHAREHGAALGLDDAEHGDGVEGRNADLTSTRLQAAERDHDAAGAVEGRDDGGPFVVRPNGETPCRPPAIAQHPQMGEQRSLGKARGARGIEKGCGRGSIDFWKFSLRTAPRREQRRISDAIGLFAIEQHDMAKQRQLAAQAAQVLDVGIGAETAGQQDRPAVRLGQRIAEIVTPIMAVERHEN